MRQGDIPEDVRMRSDDYLLATLRLAGWDVRLVATRNGATVEAEHVPELFLLATRKAA